eukprot:484387_1
MNTKQLPLDILPNRALISELTVHGYIRKCKEFYPNEIIKIIYNFYFIKILNYKIKGIGRNQYGQQEIWTTVKTYQKQIKKIINGHQNIYILFTDSTYECCGNNSCGQLGINMDSGK